MENDRETEQWLRLVHSGNPSLRDLNRFVQARSPGRTLLELNPDAAMHCLDRILATCPEPDHDALSADLRWLEAGIPTAGCCRLPTRATRWMLREIPDPPLALYASGSPDCLSLPCLAIVGSRNPTPQGRETATGIRAPAARRYGFHRCQRPGARHRRLRPPRRTGIRQNRRGMRTRTGHRLSPTRTAPLRPQWRGTSVLVSEFSDRNRAAAAPFPAEKPDHQRYEPRNPGGRSRSQERLPDYRQPRRGAEQGSVRGAGSVCSPQSRGCHDLIRKGAALVETVDDILREIGHYEGDQTRFHNAAAPAPGRTHARFLEHMGYAPCTRDELVKRSGLTPAQVSSMLLVLELEGCVELCPGGTYVRVTRS
jgi:DNA processing protein